jgi:hypothetical protein
MASGATGGTISPAARLAGVAPASSICGLIAFQRLGAGPAMIAIARSSESYMGPTQHEKGACQKNDERKWMRTSMAPCHPLSQKERVEQTACVRARAWECVCMCVRVLDAGKDSQEWGDIEDGKLLLLHCQGL